MSSHFRISAAADLAGDWVVRATDFALWHSRRRSDLRFRYTVRSAEPVVLDETITWREDGRPRTMRGVDRPGHDATHLIWRGRGLLAIASNEWSYSAAPEVPDVMVIRFGGTLISGGGMHVVSRGNVDAAMLRSRFESLCDRFDVDRNELEQLVWFTPLAAPAA